MASIIAPLALLSSHQLFYVDVVTCLLRKRPHGFHIDDEVSLSGEIQISCWEKVDEGQLRLETRGKAKDQGGYTGLLVVCLFVCLFWSLEELWSWQEWSLGLNTLVGDVSTSSAALRLIQRGDHPSARTRQHMRQLRYGWMIHFRIFSGQLTCGDCIIRKGASWTKNSMTKRSDTSPGKLKRGWMPD